MKYKKLKISGGALVGVVICILVYAIVYINDYYHVEDMDKAIASTKNVLVSEESFGYYVDGPGEGTAMIFYPGAKVEAVAYVPLMKEIANNGIDCFVVDMPARIALFGINRANKIKEEYGDKYKSFVMSGHSLGGAAAAMYTYKNLKDVDGLVLFAAYSTKDISNVTFPVISVYGSEDKVLSRKKYDENKKNLPSNFNEYIIEGGNHALFGYYGKQDGDGEARITYEEQWKETATYVTDCISRMANGNYSSSSIK